VLAAGYVNLMRSVPLLLVIFWFAGWGGNRTGPAKKVSSAPLKGKPRRRSRLRGGGSERGTQKGRRGNATGGPVFRRTAMRLSQLKENAGVAIRYGAGRYPEVQ